MKEKNITVKEMADAAGVEQKAFRARLRKAKFPWHAHHDSWDVRENSPEHRQMMAVLNSMRGGSR